MKTIEIKTLMALVLVTAGAGAGDISQEDALKLRRNGDLMPFESILARIEERHPGARILEVELEKEHSRYIYELEILTADNRVRELEIDGGDGAILEDELED